MFMSKQSLLRTTFILGGALTTGLLPGAAFAQENASNARQDYVDQGERDEIIVTARRREEGLQDVPLSISAITSDEIRDANIFSLEDVAASTAGLSYTNTRAYGTPIIRGLAQTDGGAIQTNVGIFMDGIYINNRSGLEFANMDVAQVEVAKGPQSALYGRDSFAGAINYVLRSPDLGETNGYVQGDIGTDDRYGVKGSVNFPIGDKAAIRLFGGHSQFDGTIENRRGGENLGGWDKRQSFGASVLFEPTDRFALKLLALRNEVEEDQPPLSTLPFQLNNAGAQYQNDNGTYFTLFQGDIPDITSVSLDNRGTGNTGGVTLAYAKADYKFDFATLTGRVAYTESGYDGFFDNTGELDAVNRPLLGNVSAYFLTDSAGDSAEQTSFDLQLASDVDNRFNWLLGGSYYDSSSSQQLASEGAVLGDIDTLVTISDFNETLDQKIFAVFGSASYDLTDKFRVGGELRYTDEKQTLDVFQNFILFNIIFADVEESIDFDYVSGRGTIEYRPDDNNLFYAYAAKGEKTGGINAQRIGRTFASYDPETNWSYEIGSKSSLLDDRLNLNVALFYIDWKDLQSTAPGSVNGGGATFNGIGAKSKGIEVEATLQLNENTTWRVAATALDPSYDDGFVDGAFEAACLPGTPDFVSSNCTGDVGGNHIAKTSKTQLYTSLTHVWPETLSGFDVVNRVDFSHEGKRPTTSLNFAYIDPTNLANYRLSFRKDDLDISFWVDNLFNADWIASTLPISSTEANTGLNCGRSCSVRAESLYPGNGRQFGATVLKRF